MQENWLVVPIEICDIEGNLVALIISKDYDMQEGHNFFTEPESFIQLGIWNFSKGTTLQKHIHKYNLRTVARTCEVLVVVSGSIEVELYDDNKSHICNQKINLGDVLICLTGGHGYTILETGTKVIEIKNGPYTNPDSDRERF